MEEANHHLETLCEQSELKEEQMEGLLTDFIECQIIVMKLHRKRAYLAVVSEDQVPFLV